MRKEYKFHFETVLVVFSLVIFFIPFVTYSQVLPPAHAFSPHGTASNFSSSKAYSLDNDGILLYDYGSRFGNLGKYHNPTFIASYANALYKDFLSGDKEAKNRFLKQVDFLIQHATEDVTGVYWPFSFENEYYLAPKNWYSGMTSGRILGVLVKAHALTQDNSYITFADRVFKKLSQKRELGGMTTYLRDGTAWLEEVAFSGSESFKILNGHIFGLAGVDDYAQYTLSEEASELVRQGIKAVENSLDSFDSGYLSYYCEKVPEGKPRFFAEKGGYNVLHIQQLLWLYEITKKPCFLEKASSFQFYENNYPKISVSNSTNSKTNGPEKMDLTFGYNYWSSNEFPTQIILDLEKVRLVKGIVALAHTLGSAPKDYFIESSLDKENWSVLAREVDNEQLRKKTLFTSIVEARYLKVTVERDNGNRNVALDGFGCLYAKTSSPVVNFSNYSVGVKKIIDHDRATGIKLKESGWLLFDALGADNLILYGLFNVSEFDAKAISIEGSSDLDSWFELEVKWEVSGTKMALDLPQKKYEYYRINFSNRFVDRFDELEYLRRLL